MKRKIKRPKVPFENIPAGGRFEFLGKTYKKTGPESVAEIFHLEDGRETSYFDDYFAPTCNVRPKGEDI